LVLRRDRETGFLDGKGGLVVGAMEDSRYETESFVLQPGESLFLYTDGVTEAMNGREELFSDERLKGEITLLRGKTVHETIQAVMKEIVSFWGVPNR
jgi:sigma-B regulation protein RsbU (phosphoserine phosphatase)